MNQVARGDHLGKHDEEGTPKSYVGPEKTGPKVRIEFDVEIPSNAKL